MRARRAIETIRKIASAYKFKIVFHPLSKRFRGGRAMSPREKLTKRRAASIAPNYFYLGSGAQARKPTTVATSEKKTFLSFIRLVVRFRHG